ncbi:hypothetical protein [Actinomadura sp. B10D3]|uniref:hypothetical protein n=1 Tax=Actinomadura sp. B10D3 TaxID=3153557 RepID=UPI00325F62DB
MGTCPENILRWVWQPGDLPRLLHRITVAGDVPAGVDGRESYRVEGDDASPYTPAVKAA